MCNKGAGILLTQNWVMPALAMEQQSRSNLKRGLWKGKYEVFSYRASSHLSALMRQSPYFLVPENACHVEISFFPTCLIYIYVLHISVKDKGNSMDSVTLTHLRYHACLMQMKKFAIPALQPGHCV